MKGRLKGAILRLGIAGALMVMIAALAVACGGSSPASSSSSGGGVLKVAYGSDWVFLNHDAGVAWWDNVAKKFEAANPGWTVHFTQMPGSYADLVNKLNLLDRSPSTAPDVAQRPADQMGNYVASGVLMQVDKYLPTAAWWSEFPASVQQETTFNSHVYGVNNGENTNALYYNMQYFKKAGIPVPWQPKTWNDVLAAAQKIKQAVPNVWPIWLTGGEASGTIAIQSNGGNLLYGSSTPTIFDTNTKKWVVDSPGLRETLGFYSQVAKQGYQSPLSVLFNPNAIINIPNYMAQQKVAIVFGGNWYSESWVKAVSAPYWPQAPKIMGTAKIPTETGAAPGYTTTLGGWELTIGANCKNPDMAWKFIDIAQQKESMINGSNFGGWVPPAKSYWTDPMFTDFAPPYQTFFVNLLPDAIGMPNTSDYVAWATGFNQATGAIMQTPATTVDQAIGVLKSYVTNQLGADKVETLQ